MPTLLLHLGTCNIARRLRTLLRLSLSKFAVSLALESWILAHADGPTFYRYASPSWESDCRGSNQIQAPDFSNGMKRSSFSWLARWKPPKIYRFYYSGNASKILKSNHKERDIRLPICCLSLKGDSCFILRQQVILLGEVG